MLTYTDNTTENHYVPFNPDLTEWQFTSLAIVPKQPTKTVSTIKVICAYEKNANTAYFDNLSLVKEAAQTMRYDNNGNLISVKSTGTDEENATYENGNLTQVVTGGSGTVNYTYDEKHNVKSATNNIITESYEPDSMGNVQTTKLTAANDINNAAQTINSSKAYTNKGNLVHTATGANGSFTTYAYGTDVSKMFGTATAVTDAKGTAVTTNYLNDGRVTSSWIASYIALSRTYNTNGMLTRLDRGGYNRNADTTTQYHQYYNFSYDAFGNTTAITVGDSTQYNLGTYTYGTHDGLLTGMTYGNGASVSYTYDTLGRKTQTTTSDGDSYTYAYTGDGQLYQMDDTAGNIRYRYNYDTLGRLISSTMKSDGTTVLQTEHQYDAYGRLQKQAWALAGSTYREDYTYDSVGRLTNKNITLPTEETSNIRLTYENLSRLNAVYTPATTTYYNYANALYGTGTTGQVSQMSINPVQTGTGVFDRLYYRYSYDSLGNITRIEDVPYGATSGAVTSYQYDNQSQLTDVTVGDSTWSYQYDTYGNLRAQSYANGNFVQRSITYTYGDSNWQDLLTGVSGTKNGTSFSGSYIYDGAGNPTSYYNVNDRRTWVMAWKNGRELASATRPGLQIDYDYDVSGLRTLKQAGSAQHIYTYASGQLLREKYTKDGTSYTLDFVYDQSNRPYALYLTTTRGDTTTSELYYYILNLQGDVVHMVNTAGEAVASYTYDAFGNILSASGNLANINPLRYRGYYYDTETGFYYLQSRYYDPMIGRFINADSYASTGQGFLGYNMFAYCENNPVNRVDESGHFSSPTEDKDKNGIPDYLEARWRAQTQREKEKKIKEETGFVVITGITLRAAFGVSVSISAYGAIDTHGNLGVFVSPGSGAGFPFASASGFAGVVFAPNVNSLEGLGLTIGGGYSEGVEVAGDYIIAIDPKEQKAYHGVTISLGGGVAVPLPVDVHGEVSWSEKKAGVNIIELIGAIGGAFW